MQYARHRQLRGVQADGLGFNLHFPGLDADLHVPALVSGIFGTRVWLARDLAWAGGRKTSAAKAQAVRANGAKADARGNRRRGPCSAIARGTGLRSPSSGPGRAIGIGTATGQSFGQLARHRSGPAPANVLSSSTLAASATGRPPGKTPDDTPRVGPPHDLFKIVCLIPTAWCSEPNFP